jgi:hypothetical protein
VAVEKWHSHMSETSMLDLVFRPLRSLLAATERDVAQETRIAETEGHILGAVEAIRGASESIEHHVQVIESLATSVEPLTDSVNHLTATMTDLVTLLAPMGEAERSVHHLEHLFSRHHDEPRPAPDEPPATG